MHLRRATRKKEPEGFEVLRPAFEDFEQQLKDAEAPNQDAVYSAHEQSLWRIHRILFQRSRFVFQLFYKQKAISRELYQYILGVKLADANLIAKWKKQGFERLCCLSCVQTNNHQFKGVCICRVPRADLEEGRLIQCVHCGCRGCASSD